MKQMSKYIFCENCGKILKDSLIGEIHIELGYCPFEKKDSLKEL